MFFIQYVTFSFDGKFTSYDYLKKFRKICGKYREEMWERKKRNLGEFPRNLCQGLAAMQLIMGLGVWDRGTAAFNYLIIIEKRIVCPQTATGVLSGSRFQQPIKCMHISSVI